MRNKDVRNRILSLVALVATLLVVFTSNILISEYANHRCKDEAHCPICTLIVQCENNVKTIGSGVLLAIASAIVIKMAEIISVKYDYQSVQTTLVSQKVRLDS